MPTTISASCVLAWSGEDDATHPAFQPTAHGLATRLSFLVVTLTDSTNS